MTDLHVVFRPGEADGPLVVLVHGTMDRAAAFARLAGRLDVASVAFDRRGYSRSPGPPAPTVEAGVLDVIAVIDSLDRDVSDGIVIVGHSFGGHIALTAAQLRPDLVRAAVVYEVPMAWMPWYPSTTAGARALGSRSPEEAAEAFMRRMIGDERWEALPDATRLRRRSEGDALLADMRAIRGKGDAPFDVADIAVPVVAAHGSKASPHHAQGMQWLAEHIADGRLAVIEGAGHGGHVSHPSEFGALIRSVL